MKLRSLAATVAIAAALCVQAAPKYVFYFIGDGMGMGHTVATNNYLRSMGREPLLMTQLPYAGIITTYSASSPVTDSAAAGTALATGNKTDNYTIGQLPDGTPVHSIAKDLHDKGYGVGIITTVAPDDATPAAFYAHVKNRSMRNEITRQAIASGYELLAGAGLRADSLGTSDFTRAGIGVARGVDAARKLDTRRILLLNTDTVNLNNVGYAVDSLPDVLRLPDMTEFAIDHLQRVSPDNFFLMVEGGTIDHAAHSNDPSGVIMETIRFNQALQKAYDFYKAHPDETLIIVTADHDTGGMATAGKHDISKAARMKMSKDEFNRYCRRLTKRENPVTREEMDSIVAELFGVGTTFKLSEKQAARLDECFDKVFTRGTDEGKQTLYGNYSAYVDELFDILSSDMGIRWIHTDHTGNPVPIFAVGAGAERFGIMMDNTAIVPAILSIP